MFKNLGSALMLLIAAFTWGTTFVAQSEGMKYIEPFTYNAARMLIGAVVLIPVVLIFSKKSSKDNITKEEKKALIKSTVIGGICCGAVLFTASSLQQIGIQTTSAGKSGFITALYILIVPIYEIIFFRRRQPARIWLCAIIAVIGFYLLCIKDDFSITRGDILTLLCAFMFAGHIVVIDYFTDRNINGVLMACIQFFISGALAFLFMLFFEHPDFPKIMDAKITILYAGLLSSGVAYTLQIIAQKKVPPTIATLIMSLESVFAALSGWLVLGETFTVKEGVGCVLVFAAVILAQIKLPVKLRK